MLPIVRIDRIRDEDFDRANCVTIKPVHENGVHRQAFIDDIRLTDGGIDIHFRVVLCGRRIGEWRLLFAC